MALITPDTVSFRARISEDELRERLGLEVLASINGLGENGKALPGLKVGVQRGSHGGYTIEVSGPAPAQIMMLPKGGAS